MESRRKYAIAGITVQDVSCVVGILLLLAVIGALLSGMADDEAELLGLDDIHEFSGWAVVVLTGVHALLCGSQMIRHVKRTVRRLTGAGAVVRGGEEEFARPDRRKVQ